MDEPIDNFRSPLEALSINRFYGKTSVVERVVAIGTARSQLLENNPNRLHWQAINESANDVRLSSAPDITSSSGWLLAANGGIIDSDWAEDGEGTGYTLYAISGVAGSNVRIREVIRL